MKLPVGLALTVALTCASAQSSNFCNSLTPKIEEIKSDTANIAGEHMILANTLDRATEHRKNMTVLLSKCLEEVESWNSSLRRKMIRN